MSAPDPIEMACVLKFLNRRCPSLWDTYRSPTPNLTRLRLVLFFAQGHNLAHFGQPLFTEPVVRTGNGVDINLPEQFQDAELPGEGHANTIGYAVDRYAGLVFTDLRTLACTSAPWLDTPAGEPIGLEALRAWFTRPAENDDPDDERPNRAERAAFDELWKKHKAGVSS